MILRTQEITPPPGWQGWIRANSSGVLTRFHSDHPAALPDFNLNSWVAGRLEPLVVFGPVGATEVVDRLNRAYSGVHENGGTPVAELTALESLRTAVG